MQRFSHLRVNPFISNVALCRISEHFWPFLVLQLPKSILNQQKQFDSGDTFNKYSFLSLYLYNDDDGECSCELENLFRQLDFRVEKILIR